MQKLLLRHEPLLQGDFEPKKLNFLFVFQVNCPGCFSYGIPTVNKLFDKFNDQVSFLGLSTAFEDFSLNNRENTELLLSTNKVVGETKKYIEQQGLEKYPHSIEFPVAMDAIADTYFDFETNAEKICKTNPNYTIWPEFEQKDLQRRVVQYLKGLEVISETFTLNQFKGTPTMIVFNEEYEILFSGFGHSEYEVLEEKLSDLVTRFC